MDSKLTKKILSASLLFLFIATPVLAAGFCDECNGTPCDPPFICKKGTCVDPSTFNICPLINGIEAITSFLFLIAFPIAVLMIIIAGGMLVTAGKTNPEQVNKAKKIIIYSLIGLGIVLLSGGIFSAVRGFILGN